MAAPSLASTSERCHEIAQSYLQIEEPLSQIIRETQNAIKLTQKLLLNEIFPRWSPFNGEISFSYNGGKDCQVLLIIYLGCLWEYYKTNMNGQEFPLKTLKAVFIDQDKTFQTLEQFVESTKKRYSLSLYESDRNHTKALSMPEAFHKYLGDQPETKAIVVGIRYADPFAQDLKPIQRTDDGWPDFLRLQPLLHWKLAYIWSFLLYSGEPICGIYSVGFSSLGDINHTLPNPYLAKTNDLPLRYQWEITHGCEGVVNCSPLSSQDSHFQNNEYLPGWYLLDDSLERCGRIKKNKT
ncbi:hypothetical protein ZYGR_0H00560 [Zygosaccharomyces rouxii]|uniref:FAD synthase n=2 Tax=Zygosaccharomyces rouxii TaxID=4956 RepID=C5DR37_ZYGRC|nr:uncharacterized protein ZYRO0B05280g [Zygosaccharomyces rouxii]KAH9200206.1 Phosphoadenosine phosphosulfate reductase family-domain-containing protein [Zygosaccharomyces rouxii]GAV47215.1 hypothetical protein ZYGR_0H00560 [Zygosaccharomyces rouxii]CAR26248.1 ZYRO0B05280p [Zygosaccharomyces rouxii]